MKFVQICSPYRGDVERNTTKAQGYCLFASTQGVMPFAPHLHNTQFLDDEITEQRELGMRFSIGMLSKCDELWAFGSRITEGMSEEIEVAERLSIPVKYFNDRCERR